MIIDRILKIQNVAGATGNGKEYLCEGVV